MLKKKNDFHTLKKIFSCELPDVTCDSLNNQTSRPVSGQKLKPQTDAALGLARHTRELTNRHLECESESV